MHARVALLLCLISSAAACSSATFTSSGGTGGASGGTGATSSGGSAGASSAGASSGTGGAAGSVSTSAPCSWGDGSCTGAEFCNGVGCGPGQCEKRPAETSSKKPVCGCDGVTYWNAQVAASRGISVMADGECQNPKKCGTTVGTCPANTFCNKKVADNLGCALPNLVGACWGMPANCSGGSAVGATTRACGAGSCTAECQLVKTEHPWYPDPNCP